MEKYVYRELESDRTIRVLTLHGGSFKDPVECTIHHHELPPKVDPNKKAPQRLSVGKGVPKYEALSWTWGRDEPEELPLLHIKNADPRVTPTPTLTVQPNLYKALQYLRKSNEKRTLWIDAVCIDQEDAHEKDLQVAMMADIYSNAQSVCIWLGEHAEKSEAALKFISEKVSDIGEFENITNDPVFADEWRALGALMIRPWFSRRWVVQEISLAKDATVHCGDRFVKWRHFETAVALFERDAGRIARFYRQSESAHYDSDLFGDVAAMGATRLVHAKSDLFRRDEYDRTIVEYKYTLSELVANLASFEAKEPHDMIYAILALAKDTHTKTTPKHESSEGRAASNGGLNASNGGTVSPAPVNNRQGHDPTPRKASLPSAGSSVESFHSLPPPEGHAVAGAPPDDSTASPSDMANATRVLSMTKDQERANKLAKNVIRVFRRNQNSQTARIFLVNYEQPFFDVCKQFLAHAIPKADRYNLDILCLPWAPKGVPNLPSWIPSVANAPFGRRKAKHAPGGWQTTRKNADPLVAGSSQYNACRGSIAERDVEQPRKGDWYFGDTEDTRYSLFVTGFVLDEIGKASTYCQNGHIPMEWLELARWDPWTPTSPSGEAPDPPERLWRTLVADRGDDGANAKIYYPSIFTYAATHSTEGNGLETAELSKRHNSLLVEFLKRMKAVVWNRKLFLSTRDSHLGLVPRSAESGDFICILKGCSVPVILRRVVRGDGQEHFEFIGECYLHTMMDGKAIDVQEEHNLKTRKFELR